jgi:hypothetical protein
MTGRGPGKTERKNGRNFEHTKPFFGKTKNWIRPNFPGNYFLPQEEFLSLEKGDGKKFNPPLTKQAPEHDA